MWKIISANDRTRVRLKEIFQESNLDREDIKQTERDEGYGYGRANNVKQGEMEDAFMNFALATEAQDSDFTKMTTTNGSLYTKLRHNKDHI